MKETKNRSWRAILVFLTVAGIGLAAGQSPAAPPGPAGPPPQVIVAPVETRDITPATEYIGHVEAIQAVDIRARVEGFINNVNFKEGETVKEGATLYVLEQDQYQARAAAEEAMVREKESELARAGQHLQRLRAASPESVPATNLDNGVAAEAAAAAKLAEAKANLTLARLNLDYTTITAPITGRIGRTAFTRGNLVSPTSGPLARIVQMDPVRVLYSISENEVAAIQSAMAAADKVMEDPLLSPRLRLADGSRYDPAGRIDFVDNQVDAATGSIAVRARFDNKEGLLLPGQYVTVLIQKSAPKLMPVVPQAAVLVSQEGRSVLVVDAENRATPRPITTGPAVGTMWAVESGIKPGEKIIVQGIQKVKPGQTVQPVAAPAQREKQ